MAGTERAGRAAYDWYVNAVIRPIRPDDKVALAKAFHLLSDETRTRRFLAPKTRLSTDELRYLTEVDGRDHVALLAVDPEHPERVLGVARYVRDRVRPDTAEFAIVVGDPYQRQGLGRRLSEALVVEARAGGIRRFTALTQGDNVPAQRLIASMSRQLTYVPTGSGSREIVLEFAA
jgi:acetyltransferase